LPRPLRLLAPGLLLVALHPPVRAEVPSCQALRGEQRALADRILATQHAYDCCDDTLAVCLDRAPSCPAVRKLAANLCRRVAAGQEEERLVRWLVRRGYTMLALDRPVELDLDGAEVAGDPAAPVTVVVYASARGPSCARVVPGLHEAVVRGRLAGKARLYLRPFPIRRNPHYKEAGLGFVAAAELGRFWEFVRHAYTHFDDFTPEGQVSWARAVGLDAGRFEALTKDRALLRRLSAGKREGLENGVASTPALFIDGHRYLGELEVEEIVDVLEEAHELSRPPGPG